MGSRTGPLFGMSPTRLRVALMVALMAVVALGVAAVSLVSLYRVSIDLRQESLAELAEQRGALISALEDESEDPGTVIELLRDPKLDFLGLGETGEFTIGRRSGDRLEFLLRQRHEGFDRPPGFSEAGAPGEPMRRALMGESGTMVGPDYRGERVLAAYRPIEGTPWGIVAKMDVTEVREPFLRVGALALGATVLLVFAGAWAFVHVSEPVVRRLEQSEIWFRRLVERSEDVISIVDEDGRYRWVSPAARGVLGYEPEELVGWEMVERVHEADRKQVQSALEKALARPGASAAVQVRHRHQDGSWRWLGVLATNLSDEPTIAGVVVNARDVTEQHDAEESYRRLFDEVPVGLYRTTPEGRFLEANPALVEVMGYGEAGSLLEVPVTSVYTDHADRERWREDLNRDGVVRGKVVPIRRRDGSSGWVRHSVRAVRDGGEEILWYEGAAEDVTEQHLAELALQESEVRLRRAVEQLDRTATELERSNEELQQFAYVAAHDLQEPLRMVVSYLGVLEERLGPDLAEPHRKFLDYAVDGGRRMQRLINDLLAYSRVSSRGAVLSPVCLDRAFERAVANLSAAIEESGARLAVEPLPTIDADEAQMVQLFQNLVGNAIKFRTEEVPEVRVTSERSGDGWRVAVSDNGIGVASEHHERIFEIFQRLHTRRVYSGTGIGLAICRRIVHRHHGEIGVTSRPGEGSTFYFEIPERSESHDDTRET